MSYLAWIILGAIAGAIGRVNMPGRSDARGIIVMMIVGIVGAFIGGFLGQILMHREVAEINLASILLAVVGALVLVWIYRTRARGHTDVP